MAAIYANIAIREEMYESLNCMYAQICHIQEGIDLYENHPHYHSSRYLRSYCRYCSVAVRENLRLIRCFERQFRYVFVKKQVQVV